MLLSIVAFSVELTPAPLDRAAGRQVDGVVAGEQRGGQHRDRARAGDRIEARHDDGAVAERDVGRAADRDGAAGAGAADAAAAGGAGAILIAVFPEGVLRQDHDAGRARLNVAGADAVNQHGRRRDEDDVVLADSDVHRRVGIVLRRRAAGADDGGLCPSRRWICSNRCARRSASDT